MNTVFKNNSNDLSIINDPYYVIVDNWEEYLDKYKDNLFYFNKLPKDVLVDIIKRMYAQIIELKNPNKNKSNETKELIEIKDLTETIEKYKNALKQTCYDLINLQERGYIVYE